MSTYTPGPWVVADIGANCLLVRGCVPVGESATPNQREYFSNLATVTQRDPHPMHGGGISAKETLANARLISAAPDLLEALDLITSLASQEWQEPDGSRKGATDNQGRRMWFISADVMQEARAAILKATGEQA